VSRLYYPRQETGTFAGGRGRGFDAADAAKKIAKIIPAEIVTAYGALVSASTAIRFETLRLPIFVLCFVICFVLTPVYLNKMADKGKPKRNHLIVSSVAFPIWAYLVSGNQVAPGFYDAGLATVIAILFSLISALVPMNR
jgi:hypothetical protein